jgi:hypothetical protein
MRNEESLKSAILMRLDDQEWKNVLSS